MTPRDKSAYQSLGFIEWAAEYLNDGGSPKYVSEELLCFAKRIAPPAEVQLGNRMVSQSEFNRISDSYVRGGYDER